MTPTNKMPAVSANTTGGGRIGTETSGSTAPIVHPNRVTCQQRTIATPLYVPADLENTPQWVCWRFSLVDGRLTKVPVNPRNGFNAKTDTPHTWSDLETALKYYDKHNDRVSGIGVVLRGTRLAGVDLDHCIDDGIIQPWALRIVRALDSYTEVSPSGTGLRVFGLGVKPGERSKSGDVELYDHTSTRFLTFTGRHLPGTPLELRDMTAELADLYRETFPEPAPQPTRRAEPAPVDVDDADLLAAAMTAKNGSAFLALWNGDTSSHPSPSEADLALCCHLAFWTGGDADRIDRLFRASGLMRDKWNERHSGTGATYGAMTIGVALERTTNYYTPPKPKPAGVTKSGEVIEPDAVPTEADVWRYMHEHVHHDGEHCDLCGKVRPWERIVNGIVDGMLRRFRCHRRTCDDWQYYKAKEHIVNAAIHTWQTWYATVVSDIEYDRLRTMPQYRERDDWRGAEQVDETVFIGSAFPVNSTSIQLDSWQTLGRMLAERWLTRKPGSRMRAAGTGRPRKDTIACDAPKAETVSTIVEPEPTEPVTTIDYAFAMPLLDMSTGYDLLDILQVAGAEVDYKRKRWTYPLSMRPAVQATVKMWADASSLPRRHSEVEKTNACSEPKTTHAVVFPAPPTVDVLAGDLHPDIARLARLAEARLVTNHGRQSG